MTLIVVLTGTEPVTSLGSHFLRTVYILFSLYFVILRSNAIVVLVFKTFQFKIF